MGFVPRSVPRPALLALAPATVSGCSVYGLHLEVRFLRTEDSEDLKELACNPLPLFVRSGAHPRVPFRITAGGSLADDEIIDRIT
jgi:hypothetical protein